jgi:Sulfotransferase domain
MALEVIGAGFGRTGTESLKAALERLGFGPCDHMLELIKSTHRLEYVEALERGDTTAIEPLCEGFRAAVDFPFAKYYREFMAAYPQAKVILTVRDANAWYDSASNTILKGPPKALMWIAKLMGVFSKNAAGLPRLFAYVERVLMNGLFRGKAHDREFMTKLFDDWNEEVRRTVPPERLLVFEVKDGWGPLCAFLGVDVPDEPFPRSNEGAAFRERLKVKNIAKLIK